MNLAKLMTKWLPKEVILVLKEIGKFSEQRGMAAYSVGGFVRDLLLGAPTFDIDIVVEGDGIAFAKELAKLWKADLTIHERFLTATLHWEHQLKLLFKRPHAYTLTRLHGCTHTRSHAHTTAHLHTYTLTRLDIATARKERYPQPAMLPKVEPATIFEDLWRRDFSINAMAICISPDKFGELVDPTGGHEDLKQGLIRVLHEKSFVDDPTRIFRAVRYEQRFGFKIERKTLQLICRARDESFLTKLSRDRVKHELWRILQERNPVKPIRRLKQLGVLTLVAPELKVTKERLAWMERANEWLRWFAERFPDKPLEREWILLLTLLPDEKSIASFCQRFQLSEREKEVGIALLKAIKRRTPKRPSGWVRWLNPLPLETALALAARRATVDEPTWQRYFSEWRWVRPDITGDDLKAQGISGRAIAVGLQAALEAKLDKNSCPDEQLKIALLKAKQFQKRRR